jgi:hypothetical protein
MPLRLRLFAAVLVGLSLTTACGSPTAPSAALKITAVTPNQGTTFGGTAVTITGSRFLDSSSITIGGVAVSNLVVRDAATISATAPAHAEGPADVVVTANGASAALRGGFTFVRPTVRNEPPQIRSISAYGSRPNEPAQYADVNEAISVSAVVTDADTAVADLTFEWSADRSGTFAGQGPTVLFTPTQTGSPVTITLQVKESYQDVEGSTGLPARAEHIVNAIIPVDVHDAVTEVGGMAREFLQLFSQTPIPPNTVLHNFQDGCGPGGLGRAQELDDVIGNRDLFVIQPNWSVGLPRVTVAFQSYSPFRASPADAWAAVDADWTSACQKVNVERGCPSIDYVRRDVGTDWVTAHYDSSTRRWWLCASDWEGRSNSLHPYMR